MKSLWILLIINLTILGQNERAEKRAIILISIPKCGTHLLKKCVQLLAEDEYAPLDAAKKNESLMGPKKIHPCTQMPSLIKNYLENLSSNYKVLIDAPSISHLPFSFKNAKILENSKIANFLIIRDPRDQIVSFAHWKKKPNSMYPNLQNKELNSIMLDLIQEGKSNFQIWQCNIVDFYNQYLAWLQLDNFCLVQFESLVGPAGGGSKEEQLKEIKKIASHMNLKINDIKANEIASKLFGGTSTFRQGKIGSWRQEFKKQQIEAFKSVPGALQLLVDLGYEKDFSWAT